MLGGGLAHNEQHEACLVREVLEEVDHQLEWISIGEMTQKMRVTSQSWAIGKFLNKSQ